MQQQRQPTGPETFNLQTPTRPRPLTPPPHDVPAGDSESEAGSPTATAATAAPTTTAPLPGTSSYFEFHLAAQTAQIALLLEFVNKLTKKIMELEEKGPTHASVCIVTLTPTPKSLIRDIIPRPWAAPLVSA